MEQRRCIQCPLSDSERAVDVGGVSMALLLDSDHPACRGKHRDYLAEGGTDGREVAMQQHQRLAAPVDLVIHIETVHGSIATLREHVGMILCCHSCSPFAWLLLGKRARYAMSILDRLVGKNHDAGRERLALDQIERRLLSSVWKKALPGSQYDREDHQ